MGVQQSHAGRYCGTDGGKVIPLVGSDARSMSTTILKMTDLDLAGKRVFIRSDLNVPLDDAGRITDDTRIRASVPGIRRAIDGGAAVMVTSHLGRPTEGQCKPED